MTPDWTAVGAIGTLLAVVVALFQDPLRRWRNAPRLRFGWRHYDDTEKRNIGGAHVRVYRNVRVVVRNKGREAALRVEVVLVDLYQIDEANGRYSMVKKFIPAPLKWTHSNSSMCEYLPQGEKLVDLGVQETSILKPETMHLISQ